MAHRFWRSEAFRVWVQYFAAGVAMIPAGIIYVALTSTLGEKRAFSLSLVLSVLMGLAVWTWTGHELRSYFAARELVQIPEARGQNIHVDLFVLAWAKNSIQNFSYSESNNVRRQPAYGKALAASSIG
jgi:hypothetical protein